jgi:hypothetical protein
MKTKLLQSLVIAALLFFSAAGELIAQQALEVSTSERFIAYSLYNFSKLIDWPNSATASIFKVAVVGDKRVYMELMNLAQNKKVGNATYNIIYYKDINEIVGYHQIIYLSNAQSGRISELKEQTKNGGVLLVTERRGMTKQGSTISFQTNESGTMGFEIARENAEKNQLVIRAQLERMAMSII